MRVAIADTHTAIWYLYDDVRLSNPARSKIESASENGDTVVISAITPVEMVYLIEKGRIAAETLTRLATALNDRSTVFEHHPLDLPVARTLSLVDREEIPDMPDRIIAATALHLGVPVISRDGKITDSAITTIW